MQQQSNTYLPELISALAGLPPKDLAEQCQTPDQQLRLAQAEGFYGDLRAELAAFYRGLPSPHENQPSEYKGLIQTGLHYYISLHELIHVGWEGIFKELSKAWRIQHGAMPLNTPGKLLEFALELECECSMRVALEGGSISVERSRQFLSGKPIPKSKLAPGTPGGEILGRGNPCYEWLLTKTGKYTKGNHRLRHQRKLLKDAHREYMKQVGRSLRQGKVKGERWKDGQRRLNP